MTVSITKNAAMHVADQLENRGHGLGTVSYTHLTLPTIYSV